jgi:hypothetical protein
MLFQLALIMQAQTAAKSGFFGHTDHALSHLTDHR